MDLVDISIKFKRPYQPDGELRLKADKAISTSLIERLAATDVKWVDRQVLQAMKLMDVTPGAPWLGKSREHPPMQWAVVSLPRGFLFYAVVSEIILGGARYREMQAVHRELQGWITKRRCDLYEVFEPGSRTPQPRFYYRLE